MPAAAVAVDSQDRVFVFNRALEHPIVVFDREGNYLTSWGEGAFVNPHAMLIDGEDNLWLVDSDGGQVMKFTPSGELLMAIGTKGYRSDTGVDPADFSHSRWDEVKHGGEPFNLPAGVALAPSGDIFVADGYANSRVHKFSPEGSLLLSWGESQAAGRRSSSCPTGSASTAAAVCSWRTRRTFVSRHSARMASTLRRGRPTSWARRSSTQRTISYTWSSTMEVWSVS